MKKTTVDIQLRVPGKENKVVIDGIDCSGATYLLIEFDGPSCRYLVGTMSHKDIKVRSVFNVVPPILKKLFGLR